jgi:hypothetical protein
VSRPFAARLLVLLLAASAGVHAALAPVHAPEGPLAGGVFVLSALGLAVVALAIDRVPGRAAAACAVLVLGSVLVAYAATRLVALPPLTHREPLDALGVLTKLVEATGLMLALRLFGSPADRAPAPPALPEGAGP